MEQNFTNSLAFKYWRLGGPPFLAPRAALSTWQTLSDAIFFKLRERWRRKRISFRDQVRDPIGALLGHVEIRLPKVRAVVQTCSVDNADYGNLEVLIDDGRRTRKAHSPPFDPRDALEEPEREIQSMSSWLAAELHASLEGAAERPYRPVTHFMMRRDDVREGCARYQEQFRCLPHRVVMSVQSWGQLLGPDVIDWFDSGGVARSTPVVLVPDLDPTGKIEVVSEAYIDAVYSARDLVSAVGYTPRRHAALRSARAAAHHTSAMGSDPLVRALLVACRAPQSATIKRATWSKRVRRKARWALEMASRPFKKAARMLALADRARRARAEMDRNAFIDLYADMYWHPDAVLHDEAPMSAAEIIRRLPLSSLPIPIRAAVSGPASDHVELAFCAPNGATQSVLTLPAACPFDVIRALVEEAYSVIQEQRSCQSVEATWPQAEEPLTMIRDLALEYERRYQQAAFGVVMSRHAWVWLCRHRVRHSRVTFSTNGAIHSLPLYLTANWEGGSAFQVASEQRIARQTAKGEIIPLSDIPPPVRRSFEA